MKQWAFRVIVALDILGMTLLFNGKRNETMSAAAWALWVDRKWAGILFRPMVDLLLRYWETDHCYKSWQDERGKY